MSEGCEISLGGLSAYIMLTSVGAQVQSQVRPHLIHNTVMHDSTLYSSAIFSYLMFHIFIKVLVVSVFHLFIF